MEVVRPGAGDDVDDRAGVAAELGLEVRGQQAELLDGVGARADARLAADGDLVVVGAVEPEVVGAVEMEVVLDAMLTITTVGSTWRFGSTLPKKSGRGE